MPEPVAGGDIWQKKENFYVIGGYSDSLQANVNWVQKYNVLNKTWEKGTMRFARFGLVTESYNNFAYFYGGIDAEANSITSIERWGEPFTDSASLNFDSNFNRNFSTGHIIGDNLYIIGGNPLPGTRSDTLPYIVEYNLTGSNFSYQTDTLFASGDLPEQQMSEVIGNDIFIFGGVINGISQDIFKFNIVDRSYKKLNIKLLTPRAGGRAVVGADPNKIYIIGGYNENSQALNSVEVFSFYGGDNYFIEESAPINEARYNFMSAYFDGIIYVMGGFDNEKKVVKSIEQLFEYATTAATDEISNNIINQFELYQNYPNPFNPNTTIKYAIANKAGDQFTSYANVQLKVYDVIGNEITTLVNKQQPPGIYEINFAASQYPSGVYYYKLKTNSFIQTKKMILLK
ncbi:MAG: T9SS type A sorting domain-containing protein [Ignavibacteriales bacterium]|nr:T9SS type A sorting domain-containing protein [Ignavibacteriales bacterium]